MIAVHCPSWRSRLFGKLIGIKVTSPKTWWRGCWSWEFELLTPIKRTMKPRLVRLNEKLLLRKRVLIETINDQLENI